MRRTAAIATLRPGILSRDGDEGSDPLIGGFALEGRTCRECSQEVGLLPLHLPSRRFEVFPILIAEPEGTAAVV